MTCYERHIASIRLLTLNADGSRSEPVEIQDDAYMQGDHVISRDPIALFEAMGISGIAQTQDDYVLLGKPLVKVKKVLTGHCILDHVRVRDAVEAAGRCLEWR